MMSLVKRLYTVILILKVSTELLNANYIITNSLMADKINTASQ